MGENIWLYYSLEDKILRRARVRYYTSGRLQASQSPASAAIDTMTGIG
jgi:hypothetical protein